MQVRAVWRLVLGEPGVPVNPEHRAAVGPRVRDDVLRDLRELRGEVVDELEGLVPDDAWPLPTYQEMLFIK